MRRALAAIQKARQAERLYLRGAPPQVVIDISKSRLKGKDKGASSTRRALTSSDSASHARVGRFAAIIELAARDPRSAIDSLLVLRIDALGDEPAFAAALSDAANAMRRGKSDEAIDGIDARPARVGRFADRARFPRALGNRSMSTEFVFATAQYESGDWDSAPLVPPNIIDTIARYTEIAVAPSGVNVPLGSERMLRYPLLYMTGHLPVRFTDAERRNVKRYVERGGLLFIDDHNHDIDGTFHKTATEEITRSVGPLAELPNDHPLYSAFFKFEGPPTTSHELNGWGDNLVHKHLLAVQRNGRIAVLYSSKDYSSEWNYHPESKRFLSVDNTRFAVNLVVYALTA